MLAITRKQPLNDVIEGLSAFADRIYFSFCSEMNRYRCSIFAFHISLRVGQKVSRNCSLQPACDAASLSVIGLTT